MTSQQFLKIEKSLKSINKIPLQPHGLKVLTCKKPVKAEYKPTNIYLGDYEIRVSGTAEHYSPLRNSTDIRSCFFQVYDKNGNLIYTTKRQYKTIKKIIEEKLKKW